MKIIAENLHIISPVIRKAVEEKDFGFLKSFLKKIEETSPDFIDFNVGPGKGALSGAMRTFCAAFDGKIPISFDSTNADEILSGLEVVKNPEKCIINSISGDKDKAKKLLEAAKKYDCSVIVLAMSGTGLPSTAEEAADIAFELNELASEFEVEKLIFDPSLLPLKVAGDKALRTLDLIGIFKESLEKPVVIGLSNVSNGAAKELRPLINRVYAVLAAGSGLEYVIADAFDFELRRILTMLETKNFEKPEDELWFKLAKMRENFEEFDDFDYVAKTFEERRILKIAQIIYGEKIFSEAYINS